jgi:hypothetical protein
MTPAAPPFSRARLRRRIALAMAVVVLIAGIAQAGHFHKLELGQHNDVHLQCLLCMHSAHRWLALPGLVSIAADAAIASYDARGPPLG